MISVGRRDDRLQATEVSPAPSGCQNRAMATERVLGIVGGVGPESTADYYRRLIDRWRERGPASTYPSILLNSLNSRPALDALLAGDLNPTVSLFDASIARLAGAGAGLAIVASVMMHCVFDRVAAAAPIPMLSILEALVASARAARIRRPGVIATRPTTEGGFFAEPFEAAGIELIRPDEADRAFIHEVYFSELVKGRFTNETRARLLDVIERLKDPPRHRRSHSRGHGTPPDPPRTDVCRRAGSRRHRHPRRGCHRLATRRLTASVRRPDEFTHLQGHDPPMSEAATDNLPVAFYAGVGGPNQVVSASGSPWLV